MYADKRSRKFSVKFNHGGYFLGQGSNRSYVNGHELWYDEVDADTWSPIMVENLVEEIGWEMAGRMKVYYCIPILSINRNGLREIRGDSDTDQMLTFVSIGHYSFSLYLDHEDSLNATLTEDDVVNFPIRQLPQVLSPCKSKPNEPEIAHIDVEPEDANLPHPIPIQVVYPPEHAEDDGVSNYVFAKRKASYVSEDVSVEEPDVIQPTTNGDDDDDVEGQGECGRGRYCKRKNRQCNSSGGASYEMETNESDSDDSDFDPGAIVDNDYDISDGDDDLYADNVDMDEPEDIKLKEKQKEQKKESAC